MKTILCAALAFGFCTNISHAQEHGAVTTVNSFYQQVYAAVENADAVSKQTAYCALAGNGLDFAAIGYGLAGRLYSEALPEHQSHFHFALQRMFVDMFTLHFASLNTSRGYEVNSKVINKSGGMVQVQTRAPFDAEDFVNINFVMRQNTNGAWLVADAYVKGMSMVSQKYPEVKSKIDSFKIKYLDPLNQYAFDLENTYPACN